MNFSENNVPNHSERRKNLMSSFELSSIKESYDAFKLWRLTHRNSVPNFRGKNLKGSILNYGKLVEANFEGAILKNSFIHRSNLRGANFKNADISDSVIGYCDCLLATFTNANLENSELDFTNMAGSFQAKANYRNVNLTQTNFTASFLIGCNFSNSNLNSTFFNGSLLSGANFSNAIMDKTIFTNCDLSRCIGLDTITHNDSSSICLNTIIITYKNSGNRFSKEFEIFCLNSGIPKEVLIELPRMISEVKYFTCFISYGSPDEDFAIKLVEDLRSRGVSCWLWKLDHTVGEKTWKEITYKRRESEKMILLCSLRSLIRPGIKREIQEQISENENKIIPISLDNDWKHPSFEVKTDTMNLKPFLEIRNYADFSDYSKYDRALNKLLKGLKRN